MKKLTTLLMVLTIGLFGIVGCGDAVKEVEDDTKKKAAGVIDDAKKKADEVVDDAKKKADEVVDDTKKKADEVVDDAKKKVTGDKK